MKPEKYRHDLEVVRNTAAQVIRDFEFSGIEINFSGNPETAYQELKEQVFNALGKLYKSDNQLFMSLLYRIDVDEKKVNMLKKSTSGEGFINGLSELILEREFMKALTKKLFRAANG